MNPRLKTLVFFILLIFSLPNNAKEMIVLGVHSKTAPLEWRSNGVDQGFNIELLRKIGHRIDRKIIVRRKTFQQLVSDIHNPKSEIDVIAVVSPVGISRLQQQSDSIYATHAKAYTRQGEDFINNWQDLEGKRVAIKSGSFVDVYLRGHPQKFKRIDVDLYETGFQLLGKGKADVVLAENFVARRLQPLYTFVRSSSDPLIFGAFSFVANNKNEALMAEINSALRQLKLSGEYDELVRKWFGTGREKVDLTSTQEKMLLAALIVAALSAFGMIYTRTISRSLEKRTKALALELAQRRKAELQISNLSQQFQSVLDGVPHGVSLFSAQLDCLWSNDNNNQLLHHAGLHYLDGRQFDLAAAVTQVLSQQKSMICEMGFEAQFWQLQAHPIVNNQVVILLEESTEQHQLRQANDEASRLASLGELSAGIAHEINNPTGIIVHSIAFISQALEDLRPAAEQFERNNPFWMVAGLEPERALSELNLAGTTIEESARRISRIVNDLKRYAQPNITSHHTPISLNEVVQVSLRLAANQVKRFQIDCKLATPTPHVLGDAQQLQQVMINLLQNASHALSSQQAQDHNINGKIIIETKQENDKAIITIRDNGPGMDRATLQRITEPFFTTRRASGGCGLGLSVSSRIIKEHQGEMLVNSRLDEGCAITLLFNLEQV